MDSSTGSSIKRLNEITEKKLIMLEEVYMLTGTQRQMINEDGIDDLEKLVGKKQELINNIDKLDIEFDACFSSLKQSLNVKSLDDMSFRNVPGAKELKVNVKKVFDLLNDLSELDNENDKNARELLDSLSDEIKKVNISKKASVAYKNDQVNSPSYYFDKKK